MHKNSRIFNGLLIRFNHLTKNFAEFFKRKLVDLIQKLWVSLRIFSDLVHEKVENVKYVGLKARIVITPLICFIMLSYMLLERLLQYMEMLLQNVSLVSSIYILICPSDINFFADPDACLLAMRHKKEIDGLDHEE